MADPQQPEPPPSAPPTPPVQPPSPLSSALVLPGIYVSYNICNAYRKYDGLDEYQRVENTSPFMFGLSAGKRFALKNPRLRIQGVIEGSWGSVDDGEYSIDSYLVTLHSNYLTFGTLADVHFMFHTDTRTFFLSAGPGLHMTWYNWVLRESASRHVLEKSEKLFNASPSINVGAGMEYRVSNQRAVSLIYNMRFWQVAHYTEVGAMFPMGVDYREFFFSHSLQAQVLLPGLRQGKFQ